MKLGRIPSGPTPHLPALGTYATASPLPIPPDIVDWSNGCGDWPMLRNDVLADCTVASLLHYTQAAARWRDGVPARATDADAEVGYRALGWSGAGEGSGARLSDVVARWQAPGFACAGSTDRITAFVRVGLDNLKAALWLCGPVLLGLDMPVRATRQPVWVAPAKLTGIDAPASWGGHCALLAAMDDTSATLVTWGDTKRAELGWLQAYFGEAWAVLHPAWVASGRSPSGWLVGALDGDMGKMRNA